MTYTLLGRVLKSTYIVLVALSDVWLSVTWLAVGMTASEGTLNAMVSRYGDRDGNVRFDDFVACYIKLKSMQST